MYRRYPALPARFRRGGIDLANADADTHEDAHSLGNSHEDPDEDSDERAVTPAYAHDG